MAVPQNNGLLNREALRWLEWAKEPADAEYLHLLTLALWGLENGAEGEWPARHRSAVEEQVGQLLGWKPTNALAWLLSNPDGPEDRDEQEENMLGDLRNANSPKQAAAFVLNAIYSRQQSVLPALQPAASGLR
jgi:hypothetical protein